MKMRFVWLYVVVVSIVSLFFLNFVWSSIPSFLKNWFIAYMFCLIVSIIFGIIMFFRRDVSVSPVVDDRLVSSIKVLSDAIFEIDSRTARIESYLAQQNINKELLTGEIYG